MSRQTNFRRKQRRLKNKDNKDEIQKIIISIKKVPPRIRYKRHCQLQRRDAVDLKDIRYRRRWAHYYLRGFRPRLCRPCVASLHRDTESIFISRTRTRARHTTHTHTTPWVSLYAHLYKYMPTRIRAH